MKILTKRTDGGPESNVTGYWLIEIKSLFSIALLRFSEGSREAYHSHAFNSISWVLKGRLLEVLAKRDEHGNDGYAYLPSFRPILTTRDNMHKVFGMDAATWVFTLRGPWRDEWFELLPSGEHITLTHGRKLK